MKQLLFVSLFVCRLVQASKPSTTIDCCSDRSGTNALHRAIDSGYAETVDWLLFEKKANPNAIVTGKASCWFGFAPLHIAAARSNPVITELLLEAGADPDKSATIDRGTPLHAAVSAPSDYCACTVATIELLKQYNGTLNAQDRWGRTALHIIAERIGTTAFVPNEEIALFDKLVKLGVRPEVIDHFERTPFQIVEYFDEGRYATLTDFLAQQ